MRGLYRFLPPFSPDQSGAVSVLFELGGIIVILDAGGCTGNICGFDEPRWFNKKSAIYSAGLRNMDAIMGRDDKLVDKLSDAVETANPLFIAFIGTPVPSVIATDYSAVCKIAEKRYGIPAIYIETTGMRLYEQGQLKAYKSVMKMVMRSKCEKAEGIDGPYLRLYDKLDIENENVPDAGIWGATALSLPTVESGSAMRERLKVMGMSSVSFGLDSGLSKYFIADKIKRHFAVSPSGYAFAKEFYKNLSEEFEADGDCKTCEESNVCEGTLLTAGYAFGDESLFDTSRLGCKVLVVHQQIFANEIRNKIALNRRVEVASFFRMEKELMRENDIYLKGENDFIKLVRDGGYETVIADPLYFKAIKNIEIQKVPLPHFAVSGSVYESNSEAEYFRKVDMGDLPCE